MKEYLRDKDDFHRAAGNRYVLTPAFTRENKVAVINLRRKLQCSYPQCMGLLSSAGRLWLTGKRRTLEVAQRLLAIEGIETGIELEAGSKNAISIGPETWHSDAVLKALHKRTLHLDD